METEDHVDRLRALWAAELPDLDTTPMSILGRIYRISNLVRPSIEATFAEFDLDRGEFDVIATIRKAGPPYRMIPTELYGLLMISSGGLTHRLDRLEKSGLIRRERSAQDKRSFEVVLTDEGIRRAENAFREDMKRELAHLDGLDDGERQALAGLLRKLAGSLERAGENGPETADSV
ncbi:MarR family winged helix-turn-helix transcriptional regulator [Rhizobium sp. KDH_Rht_773_N]